MHKTLKFLSLAGAAALVITPATAGAQGQGIPDTAQGEGQGTMPENAAPDGTTDQAAQMQAWPPEMQTSYKTWSPETQTYYWSLTEPRQEMFWRLTDPDKERLAALPEPQQETAWAQIEASVEKMDS